MTKSSGPAVGGAKVTIKGTNLKGTAEVLFGSLAAAGPKVNAKGTSLTITTPSGSPGTVEVNVVTPSGTTPVTTGERYTYR